MGQKKKSRARDKDPSGSPDAPTSKPASAAPNSAQAAQQGVPEHTDFYLRVEGLNIGAVIEDTDQLSVARGASFLLREAITDVESRKPHNGIPLLPPNARVVSTGASIGEFLLPDTDQLQAQEIAAHIVDYLSTPTRRYRNLSFGVCAEGYSPAAGELAVRERALARIRFAQLRSPTYVPPPLNTDPDVGPCGWDGRRPADARRPIAREGEDEIRVSTSVRERWSHGVTRKQGFYRDEAGLTTDHPAYPFRYSRDLGDLARDRRAGNLNGKVAVIYADGNRFSSIREETCKRFKSLEKFDRAIKDRRRVYLNDLLRFMATDERFFLASGNGVGRLRLETLLWGGDELLLVVPAWCGFDVLQHLFTSFAGWAHDDRSLTQAVGLVFCRAKTPIQRSMTLARQLADRIKARLQAEARGKNEQERLDSQLKNRFDYMVLESVDFPVEDDLGDYFEGRYSAAAKLRQDLAPAGDWPRTRPLLEALLGRFPKGQSYAVARAAVATDWSEQAREPTAADAEIAYSAALTRMKEVTQDPDASDLEATLTRLFGTAGTVKIGGSAITNPWTWIHLAELWDYLTPSFDRASIEAADPAAADPGAQP
ncbi:hypothetical protein [uncultured Thiodictyon sp.]|uniref:Cas10/Cmr2 second palm domain-containing protein n=1 Tax=uncultured Thiodictyon sp. TaxID=1846217 RepID=UPI0025F2AB30|nr:hypothetical protein [uncultured Thiodictyon sp.]